MHPTRTGDKVKTPHRFNTTKNSMERFLNAITNDKTLKTTIYDIEDGVSITEKVE
jgi:predicted O-methyltransferase YrrM